MNKYIINTASVVILSLLIGVVASKAEDLIIESFDGSSGQLIFNELPNATQYTVEWAPTPSGPWSSSWNGLVDIAPTGSGSITCLVAMCYRVVADVTTGTVTFNMVQVPAGTNTGTDPGTGAYSLTVDSFNMDATSITKAQWDSVYIWAITNGYDFDNTGFGKASDHPVVDISWYDVAKWCNAHSEKDGKTPCYTVSGNVYKTGQTRPDCDFNAAGYRLATLEEYEYAARGGLSSKRFPWGDTITHSQANYNSSSAQAYDISPTRGYHPDYDDGTEPYTSPGGSFAPNNFGLYDMYGNTMDWCWDRLYSPGYYDYAYASGGGCWMVDASSSLKSSGAYNHDGILSCYSLRTVCK